jgi:predicted nucleic acid-binding protein
MRIHLETQEKLHIQDMIRQKKIELVTSYVLDFENSNNRSIQKKMMIEKFMKDYAKLYVSNKNEEHIAKMAVQIMGTGIKEKDAYHVACAVIAECDYFITTDDRLLKYQSERIQLVTPGEFIRKRNILFLLLKETISIIQYGKGNILIKWNRASLRQKHLPNAYSHPYTGDAQVL